MDRDTMGTHTEKFMQKLWQNFMGMVFLFNWKWAKVGLYSEPEFRAIIENERKRTDRTGNQFSLIIVEITQKCRIHNCLYSLAQILKQRIRSTDQAGWFDAHSIGVILPSTSYKEARCLVNDLSLKIELVRISFACKIYVYPTDGFNENDHQARQVGQSEAVETGKSFSNSMASKIEPFVGKGLSSWRRVIDLSGSVLALVLLSPLFLFIFALIKIVSPGPAFFKQERIGYLGKPFTLWKFRTMHPDADPGVHKQHLQDLIHSDLTMSKLDESKDPRIIPFGKYFRQWGLDELPQLINVLRGEMSLIGPRPCMAYEAQYYLPWHRQRFFSVPGMTGLWQVNGKNQTTNTQMLRLDIRYVEKKSLWLDLKIIVKTIPAIISQTKLLSSKRGKIYE